MNPLKTTSDRKINAEASQDPESIRRTCVFSTAQTVSKYRNVALGSWQPGVSYSMSSARFQSPSTPYLLAPSLFCFLHFSPQSTLKAGLHSFCPSNITTSNQYRPALLSSITLHKEKKMASIPTTSYATRLIQHFKSQANTVYPHDSQPLLRMVKRLGTHLRPQPQATRPLGGTEFSVRSARKPTTPPTFAAINPACLPSSRAAPSTSLLVPHSPWLTVNRPAAKPAVVKKNKKGKKEGKKEGKKAEELARAAGKMDLN
ncbi:hypothetical protein FLONG3_10889 [Fusarium longipes]|uniref:Uncharacterized protein n=1 Tax=Fusarium longipes TaxID=694270 RepID=A0A395RK44_9HYPO|nr:hypothetical protein FLONG3_10889 [Fusarium longipes]